MDKWKNCVAIVTGANSGMGFCIFRMLAENGFKVVGFDLKIDEIEGLKKEFDGVYGIVCDITNDQSVNDAFKWVDENLGGCHVLINNAGMIKEIGILEYEKSMSEMAKVIDVNFTAAIRCARLAFKSMNSHGAYGYIININSVYGHSINPILKDKYVPLGIYPSTKYAITAASEVMRLELFELKNHKVRVTSVSPGVVQTHLFKHAGTAEEMENVLYRNPVLKPQHIADSVFYLLSTPHEVNVNELTIRATGSEL